MHSQQSMNMTSYPYHLTSLPSPSPSPSPSPLTNNSSIHTLSKLQPTLTLLSQQTHQSPHTITINNNNNYSSNTNPSTSPTTTSTSQLLTVQPQPSFNYNLQGNNNSNSASLIQNTNALAYPTPTYAPNLNFSTNSNNNSSGNNSAFVYKQAAPFSSINTMSSTSSSTNKLDEPVSSRQTSNTSNVDVGNTVSSLQEYPLHLPWPYPEPHFDSHLNIDESTSMLNTTGPTAQQNIQPIPLTEKQIAQQALHLYHILQPYRDDFLHPSSALAWLSRARPARTGKLAVPPDSRWPKCLHGSGGAETSNFVGSGHPKGGYMDAFRKLGLVQRLHETRLGHWHWFYYIPQRVSFDAMQLALNRRWSEAQVRAYASAAMTMPNGSTNNTNNQTHNMQPYTTSHSNNPSNIQLTYSQPSPLHTNTASTPSYSTPMNMVLVQSVDGTAFYAPAQQFAALQNAAAASTYYLPIIQTTNNQQQQYYTTTQNSNNNNNNNMDNSLVQQQLQQQQQQQQNQSSTNNNTNQSSNSSSSNTQTSTVSLPSTTTSSIVVPNSLYQYSSPDYQYLVSSAASQQQQQSQQSNQNQQPNNQYNTSLTLQQQQQQLQQLQQQQQQLLQQQQQQQQLLSRIGIQSSPNTSSTSQLVLAPSSSPTTVLTFAPSLPMSSNQNQNTVNRYEPYTKQSHNIYDNTQSNNNANNNTNNTGYSTSSSLQQSNLDSSSLAAASFSSSSSTTTSTSPSTTSPSVVVLSSTIPSSLYQAASNIPLPNVPSIDSGFDASVQNTSASLAWFNTVLHNDPKYNGLTVGKAPNHIPIIQPQPTTPTPAASIPQIAQSSQQSSTPSSSSMPLQLSIDIEKPLNIGSRNVSQIEGDKYLSLNENTISFTSPIASQFHTGSNILFTPSALSPVNNSRGVSQDSFSAYTAKQPISSSSTMQSSASSALLALSTAAASSSSNNTPILSNSSSTSISDLSTNTNPSSNTDSSTTTTTVSHHAPAPSLTSPTIKQPDVVEVAATANNEGEK